MDSIVKGIEIDKANQIMQCLATAQKAGCETELLALLSKATRDDLVLKCDMIVSRAQNIEIPTVKKSKEKAVKKKRSPIVYSASEAASITSWYFLKFKKGIVKYLKRVKAGKAPFQFMEQMKESPWQKRIQLADSLVKNNLMDESKITEAIELFNKAKLSAADRRRALTLDKMYQAAAMLAYEDANRSIGNAVSRAHTCKKFNVSSTNGGKLIRFYEFMDRYNFAVYSGIGYTTVIDKLTALEEFLKKNRSERVWLSNVHREVDDNMGPPTIVIGSETYNFSAAQAETRNRNETEASDEDDAMLEDNIENDDEDDGSESKE